jgi:hypothetical protein
LWGCEKEESPVDAQGPSIFELEEIVRENCQIVLEAVEAYAAENNLYYYPVDVYYDTSLAGNSLINLLPEGQMLINPFTNLPTEPVNRRAANPGEIGYEPWWRDSRVNTGYTITGFGLSSIIIELSNLDALEDSVRNNCLLVQQAVEEFAAQNQGVYPLELGDVTDCRGESIIDLLPGESYLVNPFTKHATEPVDGEAAIVGSTGYRVVSPAGCCVGYIITGTGRAGAKIVEITNIGSLNETIVIGNCQNLQNAVRIFARLNNGVYPNNVHTDTAPSGETVMDLLWGPTDYLENPYTNEPSQPVYRRAYYPGETGYEVLREGGVNVGCIITGVGDNEDVLIFEFTSPYDCGDL